jgi:adenine phosphoribosyltransferase
MIDIIAAGIIGLLSLREEDMERLKRRIRDIPNFPKEGIIFKDITPLIADGEAFRETIELFHSRYKDRGIDVIVSVESRGFIFGGALANRMGIGLVICRKPGKLPYMTDREEYQLEYGTDSIEMHKDSLKQGQKVLILDDLLATGGTAEAMGRLVKRQGGILQEYAFVIELKFLNGAERLKPVSVFSIIKYHNP